MSNMSKKGIKTGVLIYIITYLGGSAWYAIRRFW